MDALPPLLSHGHSCTITGINTTTVVTIIIATTSTSITTTTTSECNHPHYHRHRVTTILAQHMVSLGKNNMLKSHILGIHFNVLGIENIILTGMFRHANTVMQLM